MIRLALLMRTLLWNLLRLLDRFMLAWIVTFWPDDPNLDRRDDWQPRPVSEYSELDRWDGRG